MKKIVMILCLLASGKLFAQASNLPFANDIKQFGQQDSLNFPEANQVLFIGSSSFTLWKDVQQFFPGYSILNRAFGGSTLADVIRYRYQVVYPYAPRQIFIYCGENDFAASDTVSVKTVVARFQNLFSLIRAKYPTIPVAYVSMKPSPSRRNLMGKFQEANRQIREFLAHQPKAFFIDVFQPMLNNDGQPRSDIFQSDSLHMNASGYKIWQQKLKPYLIRK